MFTVLNPTDQTGTATRTLAPRLDDFRGKTVGFISNGKQGTKGFFSHLERLLVTELGVGRVEMLTKPNYSAPAGAEIIQAGSQWDFGVTGLGD